ncbi:MULTISPECIES: stage III sporulation protein AF [unclassified Candidatus Paralachnospira]|uniref:stage III sporulation protein AF n=1 Tax=unclassified Candidatus Paralachnospira TaxID=3099471 RepID=UPI003F9069EA
MVMEWIRRIAFCLIVLSLTEKLFPDGKQLKYVRSFLGMLLILLVFAPLGTVLGLEKSRKGLEKKFQEEEEQKEFLEELELMGADYEAQVTAQYEEALAGTAEEAVRKAGYEAKVSVSIETGTDGRGKDQASVSSVTVSLLDGSNEGDIVISKKQVQILNEEENFYTNAERETIREAAAQALDVDAEIVTVQ